MKNLSANPINRKCISDFNNHRKQLLLISEDAGWQWIPKIHTHGFLYETGANDSRQYIILRRGMLPDTKPIRTAEAKIRRYSTRSSRIVIYY